MNGSANIQIDDFLELIEKGKKYDKLVGERAKSFGLLEDSVKLILEIVLDGLNDRSLLGGMPNPLIPVLSSKLTELGVSLVYQKEGFGLLTLGTGEHKIDLNEYI